MKKIILSLLSIFISLYILAIDPAEGTGIIHGIVITSDDRVAPEVSVLIKGTAKGTVTDESGEFEFRKLQAGEYTLLISHLGFSNYRTPCVGAGWQSFRNKYSIGHIRENACFCNYYRQQKIQNWLVISLTPSLITHH